MHEINFHGCGPYNVVTYNKARADSCGMQESCACAKLERKSHNSTSHAGARVDFELAGTSVHGRLN